MSEIPFPPLKLAQSHYRSLLPWRLYVDHSHCPVLASATLAALPSTRAIPDRDVFYVAPPGRSILPFSFLLLTLRRDPLKSVSRVFSRRSLGCQLVWEDAS